MQVAKGLALHDLRKLQHRVLQNSEQLWQLPGSYVEAEGSDRGGEDTPPQSVTPAEVHRMIAAGELEVRVFWWMLSLLHWGHDSQEARLVDLRRVQGRARPRCYVLNRPMLGGNCIIS